MKKKKFVLLFILIMTVFVAFNYMVWNLYTEKILTRNNQYMSGDLARIGYISNIIHPRKSIANLPELHFESINYKNEKIDLLTIGDSFSQGGAGGLNSFYQDYIASYLNWNVLNIKQYKNTRNYIETIILLANSGFLDSIDVKYILIESIQRKAIERFTTFIDYDITQTYDELNKFYKFNSQNLKTDSQFDFSLPPVSFINNGNFKFLAYSLLYNFSDRAFFSKVHKVKISTKLFSIKSGKTLLYSHRDIKSISNNNIKNIIKMNDSLNKLALFLKRKNIKLIFMPVVNKYDLYQPYIIKNSHKKDPFFNLLDDLPKDYILIDSKKVLRKELENTTKDLFYVDDTHWSFKASDAITKHLKNLLQLDK